MEWDKTIAELGEQKVGTFAPFEFVYKGEKALVNVTASCGCTSLTLLGRKITGTLNVSSNGEYNKQVAAIFADGTEEYLRVKAKGVS